MLFNYLGLVLFLALILWITDYQAQTFAKGGSINHNLWTWIFGGTILVFWISAADPWQDFFPLLIRDWAFLVDLIFEHFVFFNPTLNAWRKENLFYIHSDVHGSWFDRQFIALGPWAYIASWIIAAICFVVLTIKFI